MRLYRLPEAICENRIALRRVILVNPNADTRLFVRVTQEDGHRAWSSPIYLFRQQDLSGR